MGEKDANSPWLPNSGDNVEIRVAGAMPQVLTFCGFTAGSYDQCVVGLANDRRFKPIAAEHLQQPPLRPRLDPRDPLTFFWNTIRGHEFVALTQAEFPDPRLNAEAGFAEDGAIVVSFDQNSVFYRFTTKHDHISLGATTDAMRLITRKSEIRHLGEFPTVMDAFDHMLRRERTGLRATPPGFLKDKSFGELIALGEGNRRHLAPVSLGLIDRLKAIAANPAPRL